MATSRLRNLGCRGCEGGVSMGKAIRISREVELRQITDLIGQTALRGRGGVIFLEGLAGMGKTTLLEAVQDEVARLPREAQAKFSFGYCYDDSSANNAYQPFAEILGGLVDRGERRARDLVRQLVKETGPDLVSLIPVVGSALGVGVKAASVTAQWFHGSAPEDQDRLAKHVLLQYMNTILALASRYDPLVIVLEDAHWIDAASCHLLVRLAREAPKRRLGIIVTYRPSYLNPQHPLQRAREELSIGSLVQIIRLEGFSEQQVQSYIQSRYGESISRRLAGWLVTLCNGHPMFTAQYLTLLEQRRIIRKAGVEYVLEGDLSLEAGEWQPSGPLADVPVPGNVEAVLEQRIQRLDREERQLLQLGAVQGQQFMSYVLAEVLKAEEIQILDDLQRVADEDGVIWVVAAEEGAPPWTEVYSFEHMLMRQVFYNGLGPRQRVVYHRGVAKALEHVMAKLAQAPRRLVLETARHYHIGDNPLLAARYSLQGAQSSYVEGAFQETRQLCRHALDDLRGLSPDRQERDHLLAETILLLLLAGEMRWWSASIVEDEGSPFDLLIEAEQAAERTGNLKLRAQLGAIKAKLLVTNDSLDSALAQYEDALALARQAGDRLTEFIVLIDYGHHTVSQNLENGLELLRQAMSLYETSEDQFRAQLAPAALSRHLRRLEAAIGVGEFDRGSFDDAVEWLGKAIDGLRALRAGDALGITLNYMGQTLTAIGRFEEAEAVLKEAIQLFEAEHEEAGLQTAYNLAQLGKLYLEWDRVPDAVAPLRQAYEQTRDTRNMVVPPLIRNFYCELQMHPRYEHRDLAQAHKLLHTTVTEANKSGFVRTRIAALSLLGKLALTRYQVGLAVQHISEAVQELDQVGTMPALRTEEILLTSFEILTAAGRQQEADVHLERAHQVLQRKARSIADPAQRALFLERVPTSRAIQAATSRRTVGNF